MKQKMKLYLYLTAIMIIALTAQIAVNAFQRDSGKIAEAFMEAGTTTKEGTIRLTADYGVKYLSEADKQDLIRYIAGEMGLEITEAPVNVRGEETSHMQVEKKGKNAVTKIELISLEEAKEKYLKERRQYIIINLSLNEDVDSILAYQKMLEKMMEHLGVEDYQSTLVFCGSYDGSLSIEEKDKIAKRILRLLEGKAVVELKTEELYSIYAYSSLIKNKMEVQGREVNINIVMYYDEKENTTILKLATPMLNEDY